MLDVTLFGANIPAGSYTAGDIVELGVIDGPAVVRSGRGAAYLKRITAGTLIGASGAGSWWKISVQNSDWIDPAESLTAPLDAPTALDKYSGCVQDGQNCPLTPNSSWRVVATCVNTTTTTVANSVFCTIDVDYPQVASIVDPTTLVGFPTTITDEVTTDLQAPSIASAKWTTHNVDLLKAGYEYALVKPEVRASNAAVGFIKIANAAGMGGLSRIIPISTPVANLRNMIEYAGKLVKGPMDISYMLFSDSGTAVTNASAVLLMDYVKRKV